MGIFRNRTVGKDLIFCLSLAVAVVATAVGALYVHYSSKHYRTALAEKASAVADDLSEILVLPLWNLDLQAIDRSGRIFLKTGSLLRVRITAKEFATPLFDNQAETGAETIVRARGVFKNGVELGRVELWFSGQEIREAQWKTIRNSAIFTLLAIAVIILVINVALRFLLTQPLAELSRRIRRIAEGDYLSTLEPVAQADLSLIINDVNAMARQIAEQTGRLQDEIGARTQAQEEIQRHYQTQAVLNRLLSFSLEEISLTEMLTRFIHEITSLPGLAIEPRGAFFLAEGEPHSLVLKATRNFSPAQAGLCARVPLGYCLCGRAAQGLTLEFASGIDERHDRHFPGMEPHGHYCIPVLSTRRQLLGVFTVYVKAGSGRDPRIEEILTAAGNVAAGIIERRKAEEARLRLAAAIEQADEIVMITDLAGGIQYVNPSFSRITGYSQEEALGRPASMLDSGKHDPAYYQEQAATLAAGRVWRGVFTQKSQSGKLFEAAVSISPVVDDAGQGANYVVVMRDVTAELTLQKQLRQAQKLEAIGTLAGGIAHDFNNILFVILGNVDLARMKAGQGQAVDECLRDIKQAGHRAADLVRQILSFARQKEQERILFYPVSIVKEVLKLIRATLPATIEIRQDLQDLKMALLADPTEIHQVLMNLCTNAGHAMADSGGVLEVRMRAFAVDEEYAKFHPPLKPGPHLLFSVIDTGMGISREHLEQVFDPFFTTKPVGVGTGMGLAVVHGVVTRIGGAVSIYSELKRGTAVQVHLPAAIDEAEPVTAELPEVVGGQERIMVVDDEEAIVRLIVAILTNLGYRVSGFHGSLEALAAFRAEPDRFDLVISDQTMPKLTGTGLARELLALRPDLPIILCSGFSQTVSSLEIKEIGIRDFMTKPMASDDLGRMVRRILDGGLGDTF